MGYHILNRLNLKKNQFWGGNVIMMHLSFFPDHAPIPVIVSPNLLSGYRVNNPSHPQSRKGGHIVRNTFQLNQSLQQTEYQTGSSAAKSERRLPESISGRSNADESPSVSHKYNHHFLQQGLIVSSLLSLHIPQREELMGHR